MTDSPGPALQWSGQFVTSSAPQRQTLPGDKITLPPSALEQLLSASSQLAAQNARQNLPTYDPFNASSYSALMQAESQYQDQRQQLPYPLTFRLVNPVNGRVVYAGIREFTADDGEAVLSPFLREALGLRHDGKEQKKDTGMEDEDVNMENGGPSHAITVHAKQLPKGTFVKLRPLEAGYDPEDWKALLEQHLRQNYTTLTNGEILAVPGSRGLNGIREEFRFLVDGFKPETDGVCIVDTDLEVDIEALNEEQARETLRRIAEKLHKAPGTDQGSSAGGDIDIFKAQEGQVLPGDYVDYNLSSWDRAHPIEFELTLQNDDDEVDLLLSPLSPTQRAKPRMDEHVFADFEGRPRKRIRLEPSNADLEHAEALQLSVHALSASELQSNGDNVTNGTTTHPIHYTLRAYHPDGTKAVQNGAQASDVPPSPDDIRCKNCHQWIPKGSMVLHENFCFRNNILCPHGCGQVFQKRSPAYEHHWHCPHDTSFGNTPLAHTKHNTLFHPASVLRCPNCDTQETFSTLPLLAHHRTTTCPAKPILCRFCHLVVPQEGDPDVPNAEALLSGMTPHELADGARTTECHLCSKIVRLRDMSTHLKNHDLDRLARARPIPCRNVLCGRTLDVCSKSGDTRAGTRMGQGPGNDVGLCSVCFGPLYVSMYDPENKALRRRIERKYLQQLLTGCGKSWCRNEFCKNGRKNFEIGGGTTLTAKDALPMIKPFLDGLSHAGAGGTPLHFCVDKGSQKRRTLAEFLAAEEDGQGGVRGRGFRWEWCLGALEAESGSLDAARMWLKNYAPTRAEEERL